MGMRHPRHIGIRWVGEDEAKALVVLPILPGEDLGQIRCPVLGFSAPAVAGGWAYSGPMAFLEGNIYTVFVPYNVAATYTKTLGLVGLPSTTPEFDTLYRRLLYEFGTDGNEYYGANPDDAAAYDPVRSLWFRRGDNTDPTPAGATQDPHDGARQDEPLLTPNGTMGPTGVIRLNGMQDEFFLKSNALAASLRGLGAVSGVASSTLGLNDVLFSYDGFLQGSGPLMTSQGGFLIIGVVRYKAGVITPGFAAAVQEAGSLSGDAELVRLARARSLAAAYGGDRERVQRMLLFETNDDADYLRSLMYGGDNLVEGFPSAWATALFGANTKLFEHVSSLNVDDAMLRPNDIAVGVKAAASILTPYTLQVT